jgi:16S rRNA (uracil1498-N3)-methyltransferase
MADRFFTELPLSPGEFVLDGPEAHHMGTVRRFEPGDRVVLFNGDGGEYPAEIVSAGKKQVVLNVLGREEPKREVPFPIVVGSALPKGDRLDFLLEKLVEVGATRFVPLMTERSVVKPKVEKIEKWRRDVIEAGKQCGRNALMMIDKPMSLAEFLTSELPAQRFVLHTGNRGKRSDPLREGSVFAVGPEGGFTDSEIGAAIAAGWRELSLGPRIFRIETAAVVAASWAAGGQ